MRNELDLIQSNVDTAMAKLAAASNLVEIKHKQS